MSVTRTQRLVLGLVALTTFGTACSPGIVGETEAATDRPAGVQEIVVSETTDENGVTETVTISIGEPAGANLQNVSRDAQLVAPWEYDSGPDCDAGVTPTATTEISRGLGDQDDRPVAFFVAEYASNEDADAGIDDANFCYDNFTQALAEAQGHTPGTSSVESRQEVFNDGTSEYDTRVRVPSFGEEGPVTYVARIDNFVAFMIDLDNSLDVNDGMSIVSDLAEEAR